MTTRLALIWTLATVAVSSCGGSSMPLGGTGGTGGGGTGGTGGSGGGLMCSVPSGCTAAQTQAYNQCFQTSCGAQYKVCYGPGALTGDFSGTCGDFIKCLNACDCGANYACVQGCGAPTPDCITCGLGINNCLASSGCTQPACAGNHDAGSTPGLPDANLGGILDAAGGILDADRGALLDALYAPATCADLLACCNSLTGLFKTTCTDEYTKVQGNDTACGPIYNAFKIGKLCH